MKYSDARPRITTGDLIAFEHTSSLAGKLIHMVTQSVFTHVACAWAVADRVYVFEAVQPRVRVFPLSKLVPFYWCPVPNWLNEDAFEFAHSLVGDRYSIMDCIRAITGDTTPNNRWQCAELYRAIQRKNGLQNSFKATPRHQVEWATQFGAPILVKEEDE